MDATQQDSTGGVIQAPQALPKTTIPATPKTAEDMSGHRNVRQMLNAFMRAEPEACRALFKYRHEVADGPFLNESPIRFQVMRKKQADEAQRHSVAVIGLLNGALDALHGNTGVSLCCVYNDDRQLTGFGIVDKNGSLLE